MAITARYSVVPCNELFAQRRETIGSNGRWTVITVLETTWDNRWKLIKDLYTSGYPEHPSPVDVTPGVNDIISLPYLPRAFPDPPGGAITGEGNTIIGTALGFRNARVVPDVTCYTADASNQVIYPKIAKIEVEYSRYFDVEETIEWEVEYLRTDPRDFEWKTEVVHKRLKEGEAPGFPFRYAVLTRNILGVGEHWVKNLDEMVGKTNPKPYTSFQLGRTFAKETLKMLNPRVKPAVLLHETNGKRDFGSGFEITLRFQIHPKTHNMFWRPAMKNAGVASSPEPDDYGGFWDSMLSKQGKLPPIPYRPFPLHEHVGGDPALPTSPVGADGNIWLRRQRLPRFVPSL